MTLLPDDPRLTAFALGELDATERSEIEAALNGSPAARAEVEAIRQTAALLGEELRTEATPTLSESQRAAMIAGRNGQAELAPKLGSRTRIFIGFASLAACVLVAVGLSWPQRPLDPKEWALLHKASNPTPKPTPAPTLAPTQLASNDGREAQEEREVQSATKQSIQTRRPTPSIAPAKPDEDLLLSHFDGTYPKRDLAESAAPASSNPNVQALSNVGSNIGQPKADPPSSTLLATNEGGGPGGGSGGLGGGGARQRAGATAIDLGLRVAPHEAIDSNAPYQLRSGAPITTWQTRNGSEITMPGYPSNSSVMHARAGTVALALRSAFPIASERDQFQRQNNLSAAATQPCFAPTNTESYNPITDNPFLRVTDSPLSTFSIDVDTASYANIRRFITTGHLPPADAVRIEEMINYFNYDYAQPTGDAPFSVNAEMAECPWSTRHRLLRIGLRGKTIDESRRPATNLVFLIDVSGSMQPENKLPLLQKSLSMLVRKLTENDRVAIVVYAGASGVVLPSTTGDKQATILAAIDRLQAGGSTNGAAGIQLAYDIARQNFVKGGVNRVILATDGDFNVGITSEGDLTRLIEQEAKSGVFLSVLGFGMDNLKDSTLEMLADKGNGNYAYIDTAHEARKVLVEQLAGTLFTIAKDVKIQIEFNPAKVGAYRLIGYENRILAAQDFNDDRKDAGEIGAGHTVTALYEIVPVGESINAPGVDPLKYQQQPAIAVAPAGMVAASNETCTVKLRFKQPDGDTSRLLEAPVTDLNNRFATASQDFKFAAAVAGFGMQLRQSPFKGDWTMGAVLEVAQESRGQDITEYRSEFIELAKKAKGLMGQ